MVRTNNNPFEQSGVPQPPMGDNSERVDMVLPPPAPPSSRLGNSLSVEVPTRQFPTRASLREGRVARRRVQPLTTPGNECITERPVAQPDKVQTNGVQTEPATHGDLTLPVGAPPTPVYSAPPTPPNKMPKMSAPIPPATPLEEKKVYHPWLNVPSFEEVIFSNYEDNGVLKSGSDSSSKSLLVTGVVLLVVGAIVLGITIMSWGWVKNSLDKIVIVEEKGTISVLENYNFTTMPWYSNSINVKDEFSQAVKNLSRDIDPLTTVILENTEVVSENGLGVPLVSARGIFDVKDVCTQFSESGCNPKKGILFKDKTWGETQHHLISDKVIPTEDNTVSVEEVRKAMENAETQPEKGTENSKDNTDSAKLLERYSRGGYLYLEDGNNLYQQYYTQFKDMKSHIEHSLKVVYAMFALSGVLLLGGLVYVIFGRK